MEILVHNASQFLWLLFLVPVVSFSLIFYLLGTYSFIIKGKERRKEVDTSKVKKWPSVTIQIPTKNELVALRCAEMCLDFDYPKNKFEVLIGDDSTDPEVSKKIDDFSKKHKNVKVTRRGNNFGYKPGNLNHMLKFSDGEIIVIFDSDFTPKKDFLKRIVAPFTQDDRIACVQARWEYINMGQNKTSKFASALLMVYHHLIAPINERLGISLLFGSGEAVRRSVIEKLGGWKNWAMTEDVEFSLRAIKNNYKTVYLQDLTVGGEIPFTADGLAKQQKRWAYGNTRAFVDNFRWMMFSKRFSIAQKFFLFLTLLGYVSSPFIVIFIILGFIVWFTGDPGIINYSKFFVETGRILVVNSGFMIAMLFALSMQGKKKISLSVIGASVTVGFWVSIGVFDGFMKAVRNRGMDWFLIKKKGNIETAGKVYA